MMLHSKAILGWGQPRLTEMNFGMKHAPGAGLMALPVDLQFPFNCHVSVSVNNIV